ncbi:MAG: hypothetical protein KatS3mg015_1889 [Fimbriimonadales bacterium]|nr:MAG: hypothetical protein KatS3mg015_1889 [Fimbriimonadales bacterium]
MREWWMVLRKETLSELRGKHGLYLAFLTAFVSAVAIGLAASIEKPPPSVAAALVELTLLFTAVHATTRTFLLEEEQGTGDLLRTLGNPVAVYLGKMTYNLLLLLFVAALALPVVLLLTGFSVVNAPLFLSSVGFGCMGLAAAISFCGALASRSRGGATAAGVISLPILLPWVWMGLNAFRVAFGDVAPRPWASCIGLLGLAMVFGAAGPWLYAIIWRK